MDTSSYFEEWLTKEEIEVGIEDSSIVVGALRINAKMRNQAFVTVKDMKFDVFVDGDKNRNRALNGDIVAVRLLPKSEWHKRSHMDAVEQVTQAFENVDISDHKGLWQPLIKAGSDAAKAPESASKEAAMTKPAEADSDLQPAGKVVAVVVANEESGISIERERAHSHIGVLVPHYGFERTRPNPIIKGKPLPAGDRSVEFRPLDARIPYMHVPREQAPMEFLEDPCRFAPPNGQLFEAVMTDWDVEYKFPRARIIRQVGEAGEIGPQTDAILIETNCDHGEFPEEAIQVLKDVIPQDGWKIPEDEIKKRRDLRDSKRIFTIDPATAKDLDDALHIIPIPAGKARGKNGQSLPAHFEVGVHIADVSYFLEHGTALDKEAKRRSTTVYLVNKVIPMLPSLLSEELCSLNEGVDRLAYSCIWLMTADGEMLENAPAPWFGRTVIRSCARLDYGLAQRLVDGIVTAESVDTGNDKDIKSWPDRRAPYPPTTKQQVIDDVRNLVSVGMHRRQKRFDKEQGGALAMKQTKMSFAVDEKGNPTTVVGYPLHDTNRTIEEFMLMANFLVAQQLILRAGKLAFIRHHPRPDPKGMTSLFKMLENKGIKVDASAIGSASGLHETLNRFEKRLSPKLMEILYALMRKPMKPAKYGPAGSLEQHEWRHWALNIPYYTHFTSPIRRYADVIVHRELTAVLSGEVDSIPDSLDDLVQTAEHCNDKKEQSKKAQDASDNLFLAVLARDRYKSGNPILTSAVVQDLGPNSFTIYLIEFGLEMRLHATNNFDASNVRATFADDEEAENVSKPETKGRSAGYQKGQRDQDTAHAKEDHRGKAEKNHDGCDIVSLSFTVTPAWPKGSTAREVKLEMLTYMQVILEPTTVNSARLSVAPKFVSLEKLEGATKN